MNLETKKEVPTRDVPKRNQGETLAEGITTVMYKGLEPLPAAKKTRNKLTKYRGGRRDGIIDDAIEALLREGARERHSH